LIDSFLLEFFDFDNDKIDIDFIMYLYCKTQEKIYLVSLPFCCLYTTLTWPLDWTFLSCSWPPDSRGIYRHVALPR